MALCSMLLATFAALSNAPPTIQCPNGTVYMEVNKAFSFSGASRRRRPQPPAPQPPPASTPVAAQTFIFMFL